jgi:hypothetical protein
VDFRGQRGGFLQWQFRLQQRQSPQRGCRQRLFLGLKTFDDQHVLGESRYVVLARELTKTWESIHGAPIGELVAWVKDRLIEDESARFFFQRLQGIAAAFRFRRQETFIAETGRTSRWCPMPARR